MFALRSHKASKRGATSKSGGNTARTAQGSKPPKARRSVLHHLTQARHSKNRRRELRGRAGWAVQSVPDHCCAAGAGGCCWWCVGGGPWPLGGGGAWLPIRAPG